MVSLSEVPELHGSNKGPLRAIAILSKQRFPSLPDVPTAEETGIAVTMTAERGFAAPKAIPDEIAKKLEAAIAEGLRDPEFIKSSPGDAPVIAFMPGAEWQKRLDDMSQGAAAAGGGDEGAGAEVRCGSVGGARMSAAICGASIHPGYRFRSSGSTTVPGLAPKISKTTPCKVAGDCCSPRFSSKLDTSGKSAAQVHHPGNCWMTVRARSDVRGLRRSRMSLRSIRAPIAFSGVNESASAPAEHTDRAAIRLHRK